MRFFFILWLAIHVGWHVRVKYFPKCTWMNFRQQNYYQFSFLKSWTKNYFNRFSNILHFLVKFLKKKTNLSHFACSLLLPFLSHGSRFKFTFCSRIKLPNIIIIIGISRQTWCALVTWTTPFSLFFFIRASTLTYKFVDFISHFYFYYMFRLVPACWRFFCCCCCEKSKERHVKFVCFLYLLETQFFFSFTENSK